MAIKSVDAQELYNEYFERVRNAIEQAIERGDSVASIAQRVGVHRGSLHQMINGTYPSVINSALLIAFDIEFNLGIFKKS